MNMKREYKAIVVGTCTGTASSRHTSMELAWKKANKNNQINPRYPMKAIAYSETYWKEMH